MPADSSPRQVPGVCSPHQQLLQRVRCLVWAEAGEARPGCQLRPGVRSFGEPGRHKQPHWTLFGDGHCTTTTAPRTTKFMLFINRPVTFLCPDCNEVFHVLEDILMHNCQDSCDENVAVATGAEADPSNPPPVEAGPSNPTSTEESTTKVEWRKAATLKLIELYSANMDKFRSAKYKKKQVWQMIAQTMRQMRNDKEQGAEDIPEDLTWQQAEGRWKTLTASYRRCVDNNTKTGRPRKTCKFYDELSEVYGYKPNVKPKYVVTSELVETGKDDSGSATATADDTGSSTSSITNVTREPEPGSSTRAIGKKRKSTTDQYLKFLSEYQEKQAKIEERKLESFEKASREKNELMSGILKVLKDFANKK